MKPPERINPLQDYIILFKYITDYECVCNHRPPMFCEQFRRTASPDRRARAVLDKPEGLEHYFTTNVIIVH